MSNKQSKALTDYSEITLRGKKHTDVKIVLLESRTKNFHANKALKIACIFGKHLITE